jgi:hypothetical protein
MEVLVAIFIMGVGMLSLLTLFPLGALNIGRALQDDRTAGAAAMAENIALAQDVRHDQLVVGGGNPPANNNYFLNPFPTQPAPPPPAQPQYPLPANWPGPSWPVYVDPFGVLLGANTIGALAAQSNPGLPRCNLCFSTNNPGRTTPPPPTPLSYTEAVRWFTLLDDITFTPGGVPDTSFSGGYVQRAERFTWAYLLRRPRASSDAVTDLSVVVYAGRTTSALGGENPYAATGAKDTNAVVVTWDPATQEKPAIRIGTWILDATYDQTTLVAHGDFYRVVNVTEDPAVPNQLTLELQTNLRADLLPVGGAVTVGGTVVVMENVVEVFDKGDGWQP